MIRIFVNEKELVLKRDTTLTVELNNALFAQTDIEGDISFTFSMPVEGNEKILDFANRAQFPNIKEVDCSVYVNGHDNWNGKLFLQKSSYNTIQTALVINPYPYGFSSRSLTEDNDTERVVSQNINTHDSAWESFLVASVNDPDVKFAPFFNEEGYGSDNEDYGFWNNHSRQRIVNALFYTPANTLIDSNEFPFSKTHNEIFPLVDSEEGETTYEFNQLAFCPQLRIARIMDIWCRNAGYILINHLGDDLNATFLQSQKSLDATAAQYLPNGTTIIAETYNILNTGTDWHYLLTELDEWSYVDNGGNIRPNSTGWWELELVPLFSMADAIKILDNQVFNDGVSTFDTIMDFGFNVAVYSGDQNLQNLTDTIIEEKYKGKTIRRKIYVPTTLVTAGIRFVMFYKIKYGQYYAYKACNLKWEIHLHSIGIDEKQSGFNIFRSKFNIPELLPDVSNASFLKTMIDTLGLCFFVSGKTKTIELVPYSRLDDAKSLDLTPYELTRETETETPDETMRTFRLAPLKDEDYNKNLRLPDVEVKLPDAYNSHEHLVLRTKTNTLYRASKLEDEISGWIEGWEEYSGNPDRLEIGEGDEENREPAVRIPHQRFFSTGRKHPDTDTLTGETPQLMVADFTICSDLYNTSEKPSDIILTQYRGFLQRCYSISSQYPDIKNEVMLPVWGNQFALKAKGVNSLGEKYVKPVLDLLSHKTVTYKFRLPPSMMQQVEDLLRPSELEPGLQTRFLIVRNVKTVPKKITFQIDNDRDDTVLCQIEAVKVY